MFPYRAATLTSLVTLRQVRANETKLKLELQLVRLPTDAAAFVGKLLDLAFKDQVPVEDFLVPRLFGMIPRKSDIPERPSSAPELLNERHLDELARDLFPVRTPAGAPRLKADLRKGTLSLKMATDGSGTLRLCWGQRAPANADKSKVRILGALNGSPVDFFLSPSPLVLI